ncbi:MAG TPA: hypothetical protein VGK77_04995 [Candidatus Binatia bacterium]
MFVALFLLALPSLAAVAPVTCGATLSGAKIYTLAADLDCSTATTPITVTNRAVLNLNNHTYVGKIIMDGSRAQLKDGTIECTGDLFDVCVKVLGTGRHIIRNVVFLGSAVVSHLASTIGVSSGSDNNSLVGNSIINIISFSALIVGGSNNILQQNRIIGADQEGFFIRGDGNQLIGNYAAGIQENFQIDGNNNVLTDNVASDGSSGYEVSGTGNRLTRNWVTNSFQGFLILSGSNIIENNIAVLNAFDLAGCDSNIYQNNIFQTSNIVNCD